MEGTFWDRLFPNYDHHRQRPLCQRWLWLWVALAATGVPEPSSAVLILAAMLALAGCRRVFI